MEQNEILEQPLENLQTLTDGKSEIENNAQNILSGSKFKSVDDLFSAYSNLESEFTKKCQALKELQKTQPKSDNELGSPQKNDEENLESVSSHKEISKSVEKIFEEQSNVSDSNEVLTQEMNNLANNSNDEMIQQYVTNNEKIKKYIIEQYLTEVTQSKPPSIISGGKGSAIATSEPTRAQNLSEAKQLVRQMLEES